MKSTRDSSSRVKPTVESKERANGRTDERTNKKRSCLGFPVAPLLRFAHSFLEVTAIEVRILPLPTFLTICAKRLQRIAVAVAQIHVRVTPGIKLYFFEIPLRIPPLRNVPTLRLRHQCL